MGNKKGDVMGFHTFKTKIEIIKEKKQKEGNEIYEKECNTK